MIQVGKKNASTIIGSTIIIKKGSTIIVSWYRHWEKQEFIDIN